MDSQTTIETLKEKAIAFRDARNWRQFHDAKNVAAALSIESAELQEIFLWKKDAEVRELIESESGHKKIKEEIADVMMFLLYLSEACGIDLSDAVEEKIIINSKKYPVDKSFNCHKKYTDL